MIADKWNLRVWLREWLHRPTESELKELKRLQDEADRILQGCLSSLQSSCAQKPQASTYPELAVMSQAMAAVDISAAGFEDASKRYADEARAYRDSRVQDHSGQSFVSAAADSAEQTKGQESVTKPAHGPSLGHEDDRSTQALERIAAVLEKWDEWDFPSIRPLGSRRQ